MGTKISWVINPDGTPGETINPVVGCSKVSVGCQNCYAESMARRLANMKYPQYDQVVEYGFKGNEFLPRFHGWNGKTAFVTSELKKPYKWKKPRTIFVSSMGDLFHESVDVEWQNSVMEMVMCCPQHTFLFLSKRATNMYEYFRDFPYTLRNVAVGVSVEDQATANERIPVLLQIPAAKRFISYEPAIGPVDFSRFIQCDHAACNDYGTGPCDTSPCPSRPIASIIVGGESGPKARPMHPAWVRSVRDLCAAVGVPFMFKQWGEWAPYDGSSPDICDFSEQTKYRTMEWENGKWNDVGYPLWCDFEDNLDAEECTGRVGSKKAGNMIDGRTHTELAWGVRK